MEHDLITLTENELCISHILDAHLKARLQINSHAGECFVCITEGMHQSRPVVNLGLVAEIILSVADRLYDHEGFVIEHEQLLKPHQTVDVVQSILEGCVQPTALEVMATHIAKLIGSDYDWFEPFDEAREAGITFEWADFEANVKHVSRLLSPVAGARPDSAPEKSFTFVQSLLVLAEDGAGLVQTLSRGTKLYRARIERDARDLEKHLRTSPATGLGPAPADRVSAGRMNAQGVPMLYVAREADTACAEVASHSPYDEAVVGTFILQQPLRILDLTTIPARRSLFDETREPYDERLRSLSFYVDQITRPVILDDNHPVDYVPSQIITDAFRWWTTPRIDGIAYPSRIRTGGKNIVLFFGDSKWFEEVGKPSSRFARFQRAEERGTGAPLFVIDPKTVRRYQVTRALSVQRSDRSDY